MKTETVAGVWLDDPAAFIITEIETYERKAEPHERPTSAAELKPLNEVCTFLL